MRLAMKKVKFNKKNHAAHKTKKKAIHEDLHHAVDQENKDVSRKKSKKPRSRNRYRPSKKVLRSPQILILT